MTREKSTSTQTRSYTGLEIAVIGMAGRFPGAKNVEEFWNNLIEARETITFYSNEELVKRGLDPQLIENPNFVKIKSLLEDKDCFDASFFGYTPREAEVIAPHIRVFFECAWWALEDAGYDPAAYEGLIGCYAGSGSSFDWQLLSMVTGKNRELGEETAVLLNNKDGLSTWLAYKLDLKGPCFTCYTACSTSLLTIHLASRALLTGECDMALAGGVSIMVSDKPGYLHQEGMVFSPDGHCRSFDAKASGTIFGEGVGVVVLKRLNDAIKEKDHIYALVKGSAVNNDGIDRVGYTAPGTLGQREVIKRALRAAKVGAESISYVETHGTATILGDPIEIEALTRAFQTDKRNFCALGSVKTNVGHLDIAAGVTGFIKTVLALKHRQLPPSLHFETPNPRIDFKNSPFYVNTRLKEWKNDGYPLRAGVSAFGIGGTNAHVILEEAPGTSGSVGQWVSESVKKAPEGTRGLAPLSNRQYQLILLSAKTESALDKMTQNLVEYFKKSLLNHGNPVKPGQIPADAAYTLQVGRRVFPHRRMLVCSNIDEAIAAFSNPTSREINTYSCKNEKDAPSVVFMFSAQGSQYVNMGRELYETEPEFRKYLDHCFEALEPLIGFDIKEILYPKYRSDRSNINRIEIAQPLVFIFEYALAKLLMKWGITPNAMIGYSLGEYTAACISGVFSLEDALKVVVTRGELISGTPPGAMLSVPLPKDQLLPLLPPRLSLAVDNDISCLVSGPDEIIAAFEKQMRERECMCMRLQTSIAGHSSAMEPILEEFRAKVREVKLNPPGIPYISNVTGEWISAAQTTNPGYWSAHLRQTVQFATCIKEMVKKEKHTIFIEIGPGSDLSALILRYLENNPGHRVINLVRHPRQEISDVYYLLTKIGHLWLYGKKPNWRALYPTEMRQRVSLPFYPFDTENNRYPAEGDAFAIARTLLKKPHSITKNPDISDWFYQPSWKRLNLMSNGDGEKNKTNGQFHWLVFITGSPDIPSLCLQLIKKLKQQHDSKHGPIITTVEVGAKFKKVNEHSYKLNPGSPGDYAALLDELGSHNSIPGKILHLWNITGKGDKNGAPGPGVMDLEKAQEPGFYSLVYLAKAIGKQDPGEECKITIVTDNMQEVVAETWLSPGKKTLLAPIIVIPQEYPMISCRSIDIVVPPQGSKQEERLVDQLIAEVNSDISDTIVAFRGNQRWVPGFEPLPLEHTGTNCSRLREQGVYLIIGGPGSPGVIMAESLLRHLDAKLALINEPHGDKANPGIQKLKELQDQGAEVLVMEADYPDEEQMKTAITRTEKRLGTINGVIYAAAVRDAPPELPIHAANKEQWHGQLVPGIRSLPVLERLLPVNTLDFCLVLSSKSSILGGAGYAPDSAVNLFTEAFVSDYNQRHSSPWISINWETWPGESADNSLTINPAEGFEVLRRILNREECRQVVLSTAALHNRIRRNTLLNPPKTKEKSVLKPGTQKTTRPKPSPSSRVRPNVMSHYVAPGNPTEKTIAGILQEMFGYEKVGIEDDFFELGIDSIKMIQIRTRLNKKGYNVELADFFQYPNIALLSPVVKTMEFNPEAEELTGTQKLTPRDLTYKDLGHETFKQLKEEYPIEDIYTLSPMQEGMLFHSLYERKNTFMYFEQLSYSLQGSLDITLVEKSLNELLKRHDVLRTVFIHEKVERPLQIVLKERQIEFYYEDLRHMPVETGREKENFIKEFKEKDRERSFDLSKDVLMRVAVLQPEDHQYQLIWSYPHILMDGWCLGILTAEYFEIYSSYLYNRPHRLAAAKPYRTYIQWLESLDKEKMKNYWRNYLAGYEEAVGIPKKKNQVIFEDEYKSASTAAVLEADKVRRLQQISVRSRVILNTIFQAVWGILLGKYSGKRQADVVFGGVVSGRPSQIQGVENMVGCFINAVPIRIRFNETTTFNELIREVQNKAVQSEPYHYCSLAEIQMESTLTQNLLDHIYEFQNFPLERQMEDVEKKIKMQEKQNKTKHGGTLQLSNTDMFEQGNYDLGVSIIPRQQLVVSIGYNSEVYEKETVERAGLHSLAIIDQIIENEKITIGEITLLSEAEKNQILVEFNNNKRDFSRDKNIPQFIEKHAKEEGNRVALAGLEPETGFTEYISYKELNQQVNRLARVLETLGIQRDDLVGISMKRSPLLVTAILAAWKAGGAYIPLDPQYPVQRISHILNDSNALALITPSHMVTPQLEEAYKEKIIPLDVQNKSKAPVIPGDAPVDILKNPDRIMDMNALAYVIYTSGSTGTPKGVMVEHIGMMNHIQAKINDLQMTENSIVAQNSSHTFDISVWQFFTALTLKGKTVIYPDEWVLDPRQFISRVVNHQVTILEVVPSYLSILLDTIKEALLPGSNLRLPLDYLLVTGEEVKAALVGKWFALYPDIPMVNAYGPTEASDDITHYVMHDAPDRDRIPIGTPLQNFNIYIVDHNMQLCPVGVKGEICVSGIGVGRGYLKDEQQTRQVFMEDPFVEEKGVRFYKTGDLGSWLPNGTIEFFGRKDYQVKIRGFRIELGEIENRLSQHRGIKEAVVIDREDNAGNKYLCAYIVPNHHHSPGPNELREFLSGSLPDYMIPLYFMELDRIPLTSNGKTDRKALPLMELKPGDEYIAPGNEIEETLANIWADILEIDKKQIGINYSFFELGGHSLKATVLMWKINKAFQVEVPLVELFKKPTIQSLSGYIQAEVGHRNMETHGITSISETEDKNIVLIRKASKEREKVNNLFLVHPGTGEVEGFVELCGHLSNAFDYWGIRAIKIEKYAPENITIKKIARTYIRKIKEIQTQGPYYIAARCAGCTIAFEMIRQLEKKGEKIAFFAFIHADPPIKSTARKVKPFTRKSEIAMGLQLLPENNLRLKLKENPNNPADLNQLWHFIVNLLEKSNKSIENIKKFYSPDMLEVMKDFDKMSIKELINYLNTIRTYVNARNAYIPQTKIKTRIHFFRPAQPRLPFINHWNHYCHQPVKFYDVPTSYNSMFKMPGVVSFAQLFDEVLARWKKKTHVYHKSY